MLNFNKTQQVCFIHVRVLATLAAALILLAGLVSPALAIQSHILVDAATGKVLEAENAKATMYPASLTKMMTLYMTFEVLENGELGWDTRLTMSENAESKEPYKFAVGVGNKITVREAVMGMIVISTNDAATAIAERLGGSEAAFGKLMTAKARALGMKDTVFTNPSGLPDPAQVTTARDMALLGLSLMRHFPEKFKLFASKGMKFRGMKFRGHNPLLGRYEGVDGIKTGYTKAAGYNLVTSVKRNGKNLLGVVLGAKSGAERKQKMIDLLNRHLDTEKHAAAN
jgi:D-alanyl-D-alanine carboxypeptidase (penicillin-binding protein 5/6)